MSLSQRIAKFIEKEKLLPAESKVVVGASGGVDSMSLVHVLHNLGYNVVVAHINYKLRGKDSDKDQKLVHSYCEKLGLPFHLHEVSIEESVSLES